MAYWLSAIAAGCLLAGCSSHPVTANVNTDQSGTIAGGATVGVTSNIDVGVNGTGNPNDGTWTAGVTVTFRDLPSADAVAALDRAHAERQSDKVFILTPAAGADRNFVSDYFLAIKYAIREHAEIKPLD